MKRLAILAVLFWAGMCCAQTSNVTATITDPDGQTWNNGSYVITFVPAPGQQAPYTYNGGQTFTQRFTGSLNGSGQLSAAIADNSFMQSGAQWQFTICPNASFACSNINVTVSGASPNISSQLNHGITAPRFGAGSNAYGYLDGEVGTPAAPLLPGSAYWNVTSGTCRQYTGAVWQDCGGGGGGGGNVSTAGLTTPFLPKATGATTIGNSSVSDNGTTVSTTEPISGISATLSDTSATDQRALNVSWAGTADVGNCGTAGNVSCGAGSFLAAPTATQTSTIAGVFGQSIWNGGGNDTTTVEAGVAGRTGMNAAATSHILTEYGLWAVRNQGTTAGSTLINSVGVGIDQLAGITGPSTTMQLWVKPGTSSLFTGTTGNWGIYQDLGGQPDFFGPTTTFGGNVVLQPFAGGGVQAICVDNTGKLTNSGCPSSIVTVTGAPNQINSSGGSSPVISLAPTILTPGSINGVFIAGTTANPTVQATMTSAAGGTSQTPQTYGGSDAPNGTRLVSRDNPQVTTQTNGSQLCDYRLGGLACSIYNPLADSAAGNELAPWQHILNWNQVQTSNVSNLYGNYFTNTILGGLQNAFYNGYTHKSTPVAGFFLQNNWSTSQDLALIAGENHYGLGDSVGINAGVNDFGGSNANSDEGRHALLLNSNPGFCEFRGTIGSGGSTGSTAIAVASDNTCNGTQGEGRIFYDLSQVINTGTITSITGSSGLDTVTFSGVTQPVSTITTTTSAITVPGGSLTPGSVNVPVSSSAGFVNGSAIRVADTATIEDTKVTAVPDGTHITAVFALPHSSGTTVATGGLSSYFLDIPSDDWMTSGQSGYVGVTAPLRKLAPVVSSPTSGTAIIWVSVSSVGTNYEGNVSFPGAAYNLYPGTFAAPFTNNQSNTIPLSPNGVPWVNGDSVSLATWPYQKSTIVKSVDNQFLLSPSVVGGGESHQFNGVYNSATAFLGYQYTGSPTLFSGMGGNLGLPTAFLKWQGPVKYGLDLLNVVPTSMGAVINVPCPYDSTGILNCVGGTVKFVQMANGAGTDDWEYNTATTDEFWRIHFKNRTHNCTFGQSNNGLSCDAGIGAANFFMASAGSHLNAVGASNDLAGTVSVSAATSGAHSFSTAFGNAPQCVLTPQSDPTATGTYWVTTSTTAVTANVSVIGTINFTYICIGH